MRNNSVNEIENITLSAKQIKSKLEDAFAYDHNKYKETKILFDTKPHRYYKLPFSDFKIAIGEELANQQLLLENINTYISDCKLIEEKPQDALFEVVQETPEIIEEPINEVVKEENNVNILEEIYEFDEIEDDEFEDDDEFYDDDDDDEFEIDDDDEEAVSPYDNRAKKPKLTTIKIVDVNAVIEKIKKEAIEKNKGKPVIGRRQINKMLKPYMIKKSDTTIEADGLDESLTSIDIYLNAVDKIVNVNGSQANLTPNVELNLKDILNDLENK